jgi:integrase
MASTKFSAVARTHDETPHPIPVPNPEPTPKPKRRRARAQGGSLVHRGKSWIATYRTLDGKQQWKTFHSKVEARNHLTDALKLIREDKYIDARPELFEVYVDEWLARRMNVVKPNTYRTYRSQLKKWITPEFKGKEMRDIDRVQVRAFAYRLVATRRLSSQSVRMLLTLLEDLFDSAIDDEVASTNPAHHLNVKLLDDAKERHVPSRDDINRTFVALAVHPVDQTLLGTAATTGMRIGELLGLFWDDIDWRAGTITVSRSLTRADQAKWSPVRNPNFKWERSTKRALVPPKSKKGRREIVMTATCASLLRRLRSLTKNDSPFVFQQDAAGGPLDPNDAWEALHEAQDAAGVARFGFHGVRHRYASELHDAGAPAVQQRDALGWSSMDMADRYTHAVGDGREHVERVSSVFTFNASLLLAERTHSR